MQAPRTTRQAHAQGAVLGARRPEADRTRSLAQVFGTLMRARDQAALKLWVEQAEQSGVAELRGFATGLRRDWAAVEAALRLPWSNGQTEGQITKLNSVISDDLGKRATNT